MRGSGGRGCGPVSTTPRGWSLRGHLWWLAALVVLPAGCSGQSPSTLSPSGPKSDTVATLWWILFGVAAAVSAIVIAMMLWAAVFRRKEDTKIKHGGGHKFVFTLGVAIPAVILTGTFALGVGSIARDAEPPSRTELTVEVIGHRWWWEVRYPEAGFTTANEIHVPVGTPVKLRLKTADVIHSFWVPELMPKIDLLPRRVNETWFAADKAGVYRGQCAEYCGLQHAGMGFRVVAQSPEEYQAWQERQSRPAPPPESAVERRGREIVSTSTCATCHTVRGTSADGDVGPDLTHVGSRDRLGAGVIPNTPGHMSGWVANSQAVKPGNRMPPQQLSPDELHAVVTYLQGLE